MFKDNISEFKVVLDQNSKDVDFLKNKTSGLASKDELERLTNKVQRYIEALEEINKRSTLTKDITQLKEILDSLK
jgi:16S rRNA G527 N7-methylase RsmG